MAVSDAGAIRVMKLQFTEANEHSDARTLVGAHAYFPADALPQQLLVIYPAKPAADAANRCTHGWVSTTGCAAVGCSHPQLAGVCHCSGEQVACRFFAAPAVLLK
jgi:hypothetical protein